MLRLLGYIWAIFGAYWIIFAPALASKSRRPTVSQSLKLAFLAVTFALLLWRAERVAPIWVVVLGFIWTMIGLLWVAPRSQEHLSEYALYRIIRILIGAITFSLLFWSKLGIGLLGERFVTPYFAVRAAGFAIAVCGLAFTAWARIHLGRNWSDKVVIQSDHELISSGPYAHIRHPIYSGVLLAITGTALVVGEWRALCSLLIMSINYIIKAKREDKILAQRFGEKVQSYQKNAGMLLPHLGPRLEPE